MNNRGNSWLEAKLLWIIFFWGLMGSGSGNGEEGRDERRLKEGRNELNWIRKRRPSLTFLDLK